MSDEQILARGQEAVENGCTELHIVGGIHPDKPFAWYQDILAKLRAACPSLHLKAFTAVEIAWFAEITGASIRRVLEELLAAGLGSLPGGGAEIFAAEVRRRIAPRKPGAETWLRVHRTAHELGLSSNATMLYGHGEKPEHAVDHLLQLRQLQDETRGFQAFVPLAFHPEGTRLAHLRKPSGLTDLRMMAVSRLLLDNFDHLKAYWVSLGAATAQIALSYGADDLDGTVRYERIYHDAGSHGPQALSVDQLRAMIVEAGRRPVERDTLYRRVFREGARWMVEPPPRRST
jgi:aminodeoxyfutalosine synthase